MQTQSGFSIIEVIISVAIIMIISVTAITSIVGSFSTNRLSDEETRASQYAQEGLEAVKSIKNQGWTTPFLATTCSGGCGVNMGASWSFAGTNNTSQGMTRTITVSPVGRDGSGFIVSSGGINDPDTRKVTSTVTWNFTPTRSNSVSFSTYLTNFRKTIVSGWQAPSVESILDLTLANSGEANANGIALAYKSNYVYLGRINSSNELVAINVSTLSSPSVCATCTRTLSNDVNDIQISGNYAFISSSNNNQELQIIDISTPTLLSTATLTTYNLTNANSGNNNADAVASQISGNNLYMVRNGGNQMIKFDISSPTTPSLTLTSTSVTGVPTDIVVVGNYAYVTTGDNASELQVIDTTTLTQVGSLDLNSGDNNSDATSVTLAGTNKLLVGRLSSAAPELYSIDITTPTAPTLLSTTEVGNSVLDVQFGNATIFLAVNNTTQDIVTLDGSNLNTLPAFPPLGQLNIADSPVSILYESTLDRVFVANSNNSEEFEVIKP